MAHVFRSAVILRILSRRRSFLLAILLLGAVILSSCVKGIDEPPAGPPGVYGRTVRIAYYEGGPYLDYTLNMRAMVEGLVELGWLDAIEIPAFEDPEDMASIWGHLARNCSSDYLVFVEDAFWSAGWDEALRATNRTQILQRLNEQQDIDLVIAMGTWAGQDLVNDQHNTPTLNLTSSNPIHAGIISGPESSGYPHVLVEVDPERNLRSIRLFHDVIGFQRLGVVYEDSPDGRVYSNLAELQQVAEEKEFELFECTAKDVGLPEETAYENVQACYRQLAPLVDAMWIGAHRGENSKFMPQSLELLFLHHVATWSVQGSDAVSRGVLLSIMQFDFAFAGRWYALRIGEILNGARPGDLSQVLELPQHVLLNLETARRIGYEFPPGILEIADQTYETIEGEHDIEDPDPAG